MMFERACINAELDVLLHGVESSAAFREAAFHVEQCAKCQASLTALAANQDDWRNAQFYLSPRAVDGLGVQLNASDESASPETRFAWNEDPAAFEFLAPPRHPEMLGRLGRYEIERAIGSGGMGMVFKAHDTELNRPVAIKVLAPHLASNHAARRRFAREAKAAAAVVHENVVAIHNVSSQGKLPYFVMQYVSGSSLQDRVDTNGPLEMKEVLRIGIQVCAGLAAAHEQGLVHRDVKPSNILLENGVERVLLTDFGLARAVDDATVTRSGVVSGTPDYMSPEQANAESIDQTSDQFSLGSVLYFMAAGHPPFRADHAMAVLKRICLGRHRPIDEVNPDVPSDLAVIIEKLLSKRCRDRYADTGKVKEVLTEVLRRMQQGRLPAGHHRFVSKLGAQSRIALGALLAVALAGLLLGSSALHTRPSQRPDRETEAGNAPRRTQPEFAEDSRDGNARISQGLEDPAEILNRYGALCLSSGQLEQAQDCFEKSLEISRQSVRRAPGSIAAKRSVAQALHHLGALHLARGEGQQARERHQQSLRIREQLAVDNPTDHAVLGDVAQSYVALTDVHLASGESEQSWRYYQKAHALHKKIASTSSEEKTATGRSAWLSSPDDAVQWAEREVTRIAAERRAAEEKRLLAQRSQGDARRRIESTRLLASQREQGGPESVRQARDAVDAAGSAVREAELAVEKAAELVAETERNLERAEGLLRAAKRFLENGEVAGGQESARGEAQTAYDAARKRLAISERLFVKGYLSKSQLQADRQQLERAKRELERAEHMEFDRPGT